MTNPTFYSISEAARQAQENIQHVIVGKSDVIELVLVAILCEGHVLIEDVPGTGKTLLARSIAQSLGCSFRRIQCTPDILPSDITGTHIYNQKTNDFEFRPGPIFAQIVLTDEINRATPRTQSALLEAMEERQVTSEGDSRLLPRPFLVLATQNPVELEGTFPLPEAQLDRFLLRISMGYPSEEDDQVIMERFTKSSPLQDLNAIISSDQLINLQKACSNVLVKPDVRAYMINLIHATRQHPQVELGASPRAMLGLFRTSQALAAIRGKDYVIPDYVKYLAPFVLGHRILSNTQSHLRGLTSNDIIKDVLSLVATPVDQHSEAESNPES